jgi:thiol-disulfide isomerase/thioredoxin
MNSQQLRKRLAALAQHYNSATRLADQTVVVNGAKGRCYVVRVRAADMKRTSDDTAEETFWIDKKSETVVKSLQHGRIHMMNGSASVAEDEETSATYTRIELDAQIPDQFFAFTPPQDAALVDQFPNLMKPGGGPLFGRPAPILKLKSGSGELVSLDSFRGKPVILDVWATWCQPCIKALPQLASLYADAKDKGLVLLSVDQDEEASSASAFLAKNGYTWANFHDDGEIAKTLGSLGIPRTILINPQGTVVYDSGNLVGAGENQLRSEVAKLGPDYASLAPKPARTECGASQ